LEKTGLAGRLTDAADDINAGRKGFATAGAESAGRISYEAGIEKAIYKQRSANMLIAKDVYVELQKKVLEP
jgi:hypothetical protein